MKKKIFIITIVCLCLFCVNVSGVSAAETFEIEVNSKSEKANTSEACGSKSTICARTINNYYGLKVSLCKLNNKKTSFVSCVTKRITNNKFTFKEPKSCPRLSNGGELNYCWGNYFAEIDKTEVEKILKFFNKKNTIQNKKDYYLIAQPLVGINLYIKSAWPAIAGETNFYGTAAEVADAMYYADEYIEEAQDEGPGNKTIAQTFGREFVIKGNRQDGYVKVDKKWRSPTYISGRWNVLRNYFTSLYISPQGQYTKEYSNLNNVTAYEFAGTVGESIYGKAIVSIINFSDPDPDPIICEINKNSNEEAKYNWVKYDSASQKRVPIENGCCANYNKKGADGYNPNIKPEDVAKVYPECSTCEVKKEKFLNNDKSSNLNSLSCGDLSTTIKNFKFIVNEKGEENTDYCLTNDDMYTITIGGIRYGCSIKDELTLPQKYKKELSIGSCFVWPTSNTLIKYENFDSDYPLERKTEYTCVAYIYEEGTGVVDYVKPTINTINMLKEELRRKVLGNINLTYGSDKSYNGSIIEESTNTHSIVIGNKLKMIITKTYTLDPNNTSGTYSYFDNEKLEYTKTVGDEENKYVNYKFPVIPFGKPTDEKVDINYGLNLQGIGAIGLESYSVNNYTCSKSGDQDIIIVDPKPCKCPPDADLDTVFGNVSAGTAECAVLQQTQCDEDDPIYCPDGITDITDCVNNNKMGAVEPETPYGACFAEYCETPTPTPEGGDGGDGEPEPPVYRTIFLENPFLNSNGSSRVPGANWGGNVSDDIVNKYIKNTASKMYKGDPMYRIMLTPGDIKKIRDYNKENKYDNFTLECNKDNAKCYSSFIHDSDFSVEGTCGEFTRANKASFVEKFDSCREESINSIS